MSLEQVKGFYQRLASDEVFRTQIQSVRSKEECSQIVKAAGYNFTQQEFAEYTAQMLEADPSETQLQDLNEKELEAVFGGLSYSIIPFPRYQLMYGVIIPPPITSTPSFPSDEWIKPGLPSQSLPEP